MASPAVATNGTTSSSLSRPESPTSIASTTKRKRDDTDDGTPLEEVNPALAANSSSSNRDVKSAASPAVNGAGAGAHKKTPHEATVIRDYFHVLQKYASPISSPFGRPIGIYTAAFLSMHMSCLECLHCFSSPLDMMRIQVY